jgi:hypothetical protein
VSDPRYRVEHCTVANDGLVARIKALGAIPTPFSTYVYFHGEKMCAIGGPKTGSIYGRYAIVSERDIADGLRRIDAFPKAQASVGGQVRDNRPPAGSALTLKLLMRLVARDGIEPPTRGFSVRCSTN